jgi:glycosyltransferase involved in cell wall biosynthesis
MRVLHLISSGGMYGAENVVAALANESSRLGVPACVAIFENAHVPLNQVPDLMERAGVRVMRVPCRGRFDPQVTDKLSEIIKAEGVQVLHTHGYKADLFGYFAAKRMNVPIMATCHLWTRQTLTIRMYEMLDRLILRRFDRVAAVSQRIADEAIRSGISSVKVEVVDNGIDLEPFLTARPTLAGDLNAQNDLLIGTVGRLVGQKGIRYFLAAAKLALENNSKLKFAVVGEGPDRKALEQLALDLGISRFVEFTGARTDMPGVYASFDIFVLASLDEGLPMALLEAMAAGRPCIATRVGAVPSVIRNNESGLLVEPADEQGLCQALTRLVRDADLRTTIGQKARSQVCEEFSSAAMAHRYLSIYRELCPESVPEGLGHHTSGIGITSRHNV